METNNPEQIEVALLLRDIIRWVFTYDNPYGGVDSYFTISFVKDLSRLNIIMPTISLDNTSAITKRLRSNPILWSRVLSVLSPNCPAYKRG